MPGKGEKGKKGRVSKDELRAQIIRNDTIVNGCRRGTLANAGLPDREAPKGRPPSNSRPRPPSRPRTPSRPRPPSRRKSKTSSRSRSSSGTRRSSRRGSSSRSRSSSKLSPLPYLSKVSKEKAEKVEEITKLSDIPVKSLIPLTEDELVEVLGAIKARSYLPKGIDAAPAHQPRGAPPPSPPPSPPPPQRWINRAPPETPYLGSKVNPYRRDIIGRTSARPELNAQRMSGLG